ncbi:uncharacterized protein LOC111072062 [Drosophila obscura]|uniref:uncharacterized protein LOC111072062 n=1 Tax=Drosophila obscura TaxID=7282 RepID=UPI001BB1FF6D|nr:uncharacterized protein LOC111072062 [Drosophila obscura]
MTRKRGNTPPYTYDLNSKEIRSVIEVSNSTKGSITDISDQPTAKEINIENENKATEKSSNDNGDKTEPDALPNKDEQTSVLGSEISEPGESFSHENNGKASGSSDPPKDLDDDLKMNEIQSVLEVSNLTEKSITDTSEQPNGIQLNVEDENKATEKSSNDNGDKTEPDVLPNKDEQSIALGSEISAPGKSFSHEKDGKASGSSDPPKDLDDDLKMNEIQSVLEVSNLTETSITDTSEQPNGIQLNLEDENKAISAEKSSNDDGYKTEPDVLPNKNEQSIVLGSEISEPGKSFLQEKDGKAPGSSAPPKDLDDDLKMNKILSVLEVSNLTETSITDTSEQPNGIQLNVEDENKANDLKMNEIQSVLEVSNLTETSITDTSEQPNGIQLNLEDENNATEKSSNDNGYKTEPDVLPNKDEQSIVLGSEISEPVKSFSQEKDGKAPGSSAPPKDFDDDLKMNKIQSVLEVSNLTKKSITDTSEQPNGIQLNVKYENKATEKSSNDNGDKTEPDVLPSKDEQSIGSEISEPGKSFLQEKDGKAPGSSDSPEDLDDDLKMNKIRSVLEVSNLTETSITDTSEQPNGILLNVEDENKATEKSSNDNGDKTEPDVLPSKDEQSIGSEISEPGKSFLQEKDGKAPGGSAPPKDLHVNQCYF